MLSIKFTKKERSVDQRIEKATIGPHGVEFAWRQEGAEQTLDLSTSHVKTIIDRTKKKLKGSITCRHVTALIDGDNVILDYAENGTTKTQRLSVKSLQALKPFLS
jgi:hypothetical protein